MECPGLPGESWVQLTKLSVVRGLGWGPVVVELDQGWG